MGPLPPPRELGTISHDNLNGSYNCERLSTSLTRQFLVRHPVRPVGLVAQAAALVFLIGFEIAFEPFDMAVALKRQDVRRQPVQEEAVVADHHRPPCTVVRRLLPRSQRPPIKAVGRARKSGGE